jgi:hypothetical protein
MSRGESTVRTPAETTVAIIRCLDEAEPPRPSRPALLRQLQAAEQRWRTSTGRARDEAMRDVLRISKALDQA